MDSYSGPERRANARMSCSRGSWRCSWCGLLLSRLWSLIAYSDTTPTRFMLALAATLWAIGLMWPGDSLERPGYLYMRWIVGDNAEFKWGLFWTLHAVGMWWRIFSSTKRLWWATAIHFLGVVLFCSSTIAIFAALTFPLPVATLGWGTVLALASIWVMLRTHINSEPGWRHE